MKLLLTAFDPFGGEAINPALEAVKLVRPLVGSVEVMKLEVPTVFGKSIEKVKEAIEAYHPDVVLCVGQAGGRFEVSVERVAINLDDACIAQDGQPAYFSTLPIKAMVEAIRKEGIPCSISNTAGTFVCNHLMYGVLHVLFSSEGLIRGGFIHVPFIPSQVVTKGNAPSLSLTDIVRALEAGIKAIGEHTTDLQISGGKEF